MNISVVCLLTLVFVALSQSHRNSAIRSPKPYSPLLYKGVPVCNGQFMCKVRNKFSRPTCLCASKVCDGVNHCLGGEDELMCNKPFSCSAGQYQCKNEQKCISLNKACDKIEDCLHGDDEEECDHEHYRCDGGEVSVPLGVLCDGEDNCPDGDDETNCDGIKCQDGWIPFQGSCYMFFIDRKPFDEAVQLCQDLNASLVEVDNEAEYAFVVDHVQRFNGLNWWMGLTDRNDPGNWTLLSSGEEPVFTDWSSPEEPDQEDMDCGFIGAARMWQMGIWACAEQFEFMCEK